MRHSALWVLVMSGCIYTEGVNQRPSISIRRTSSENVYRGARVQLFAEADDPEQHYLEYRWRVNACTDATDFSTCDVNPFATGVEPDFDFVVPRYRADNTTSVRAVRVILEANDEFGATAKPSEEEIIPVVNATPSLVTSERSAYSYVVGTPVQLFAAYGDADDELANISLAWTAFSPTEQTAELMDLAVPQDPQHPELVYAGKTLRPNVAGEWEVRVVASDELGPPTEQLLVFQVEPDRAPCLRQWAPIAPGEPGTYLPITEATVFEVPLVGDDLDRYPAPFVDEYRHEATFQWSLKRPGGSAFAPFGTAHAVVIDPQQFTPGQQLEVRVEVFDQHRTPVTCAPGAQTCAIDAARPDCLQRQTWRVEVR